MTAKEAAETLGFELICPGTPEGQEIQRVYCCDLLSYVMGHVPSGSAWVTVMGNVNVAAIAMLTEAACVVLAENAPLDEDARQKADENGIAILRSALPVFETAAAIAGRLAL